MIVNVFWPVSLVILASVGVGLYKKLGQVSLNVSCRPSQNGVHQCQKRKRLNFATRCCLWQLLLIVMIATSHLKQSHCRSVLQERHGLPYFREDRNAVEYGLPFTTTSFAIALLLVFRTNESYRRWVVQVFI